MPIITHILLYAAYAMVSLTVGLALNQVGGEELGSSILGGIALFSACAVTRGHLCDRGSGARWAS
ncbi:MAG: hypothetical protein IPL62_18700 [Caulobacteraceae bacterium]|nr:hypothetical protein [Caulobacteraceae bacterium]